eukprot:4257807-Prymnesium_polylepis.1
MTSPASRIIRRASARQPLGRLLTATHSSMAPPCMPSPHPPTRLPSSPACPHIPHLADPRHPVRFALHRSLRS